MEVEEVELLPPRELEIRAQAPARLPIGHGKIVVVRVHDGEMGEDGVPVRLSPEHEVWSVGDEPSQPAPEPGGLIG